MSNDLRFRSWVFFFPLLSIFPKHSKVQESKEIGEISKSCSGHNPQVAELGAIRSYNKASHTTRVLLIVVDLGNTVFRL